MWSAGRRLVPSPGRGDASQASHRMVSPAIHRGSRTPPRLPALRSPRGGAMRRRRGPARGRPKNTGDETSTQNPPQKKEKGEQKRAEKRHDAAEEPPTRRLRRHPPPQAGEG